MMHSRFAPWVLCLAAGLIVGCDDDSSPSSIASPDLEIPTGGSDPAPSLDPTEDFAEEDLGDDGRDGTVDDGDDGDQRDAPVPEPGTMVLLGGGAAALAAMRRRKAAAKA